ncbi:MAG: hypothetical protein CSA24_01790 [Deltaproteobacteria bacterium]|nr:MAG: hypothetical protein CSA24_01790 [Deltaproteobacteria bacterium]
MTIPCFALVCSDSALLDTAIAPFAPSLLTDGPQGWGMAYYQNGQPLLRKQPRPTEGPLDLAAAASNLKTSILIGQLREPSDTPNLNENTPPFRFRHWTCSLLGAPKNLGDAQAQVEDAIPDFIRRNIRGQTSGEVLFHLLLAFLNDAGKLDDPRAPAANVARALSSTLAYVDSLVGDDWDYCCIASNGHTLVATHRGLPLHLTRHSSYRNVGTGPDDKPLSYPHLRAAMILGGKMPEGEGWERVAEDVVLMANADLDIELTTPPSSSSPVS